MKMSNDLPASFKYKHSHFSGAITWFRNVLEDCTTVGPHFLDVPQAAPELWLLSVPRTSRKWFQVEINFRLKRVLSEQILNAISILRILPAFSGVYGRYNVKLFHCDFLPISLRQIYVTARASVGRDSRRFLNNPLKGSLRLQAVRITLPALTPFLLISTAEEMRKERAEGERV